MSDTDIIDTLRGVARCSALEPAEEKAVESAANVLMALASAHHTVQESDLSHTRVLAFVSEVNNALGDIGLTWPEPKGATDAHC